MTKTIGILTGGGDCPGLNAAIRGIAKTAMNDFGWNVVGIEDGYEGLINGKTKNLSYSDVSNIITLGGTILGTSNKSDPFSSEEVTSKVLENIKRLKLDTLFCIGGDGTLTVANKLQKIWPFIIGVPKTIDNDLSATDQTFGFDTACSFVTEAIDRIHSTAQSHHRVMVIEVMGRYAGWIALEGGIAGGGDIILIPEMPFDYNIVAKAVDKRAHKGKRCSIIVVSEGAHGEKEELVVDRIVKDSPDPLRLGGIGKKIADYVEKTTGHEARVSVLGHLQRGGTPTFYDRLLATRYGVEAARLANKKEFGKMVALRGNDIIGIKINDAVSKLKLVDKRNPLISAAESVGVVFGTK